MSTLRIRRAKPKDRADWMKLWEEWQRHMEGEVPAEVSERSWQLALAPVSRLTILMARSAGGVAVGFATISFAPFAWTGSDVAFLQDLYVGKAARGQGTGEALLKAVYAEADKRGTDQVFWMVDEADERLQRFYAKNGIRTPYLRYMRAPWPW